MAINTIEAAKIFQTDLRLDGGKRRTGQVFRR